MIKLYEFIPLLIVIYVLIGLDMVLWDFRPNKTLHEPPRFIQDQSVSTAIKFVLLWPYKLLGKL
jgi:hypothetical protein